jgi:hypothetical protein
MTREHLGGVVVFTVLVPNDHITVEQLELTFRYEIEYVKIQLKGKRRVSIGSVYVSHRNMNCV